jgi:hypothetical protein
MKGTDQLLLNPAYVEFGWKYETITNTEVVLIGTKNVYLQVHADTTRYINVDNVGTCVYTFSRKKCAEHNYDKQICHKSFGNIVMLKYFKSTQK